MVHGLVSGGALRWDSGVSDGPTPPAKPFAP